MQVSLPNFALFTVKSPDVTQRSVSQEKRAKTCRFFFSAKTIRSNNSFILIKKQFQVFKIAKFEFTVTLWPTGKMHPVVTLSQKID